MVVSDADVEDVAPMEVTRLGRVLFLRQLIGFVNPGRLEHSVTRKMT